MPVAATVDEIVGLVGRESVAARDTGFVETCYQGANESSGSALRDAPAFCMSGLAYEFDVRAP